MALSLPVGKKNFNYITLQTVQLEEKWRVEGILQFNSNPLMGSNLEEKYSYSESLKKHTPESIKEIAEEILLDREYQNV